MQAVALRRESGKAVVSTVELDDPLEEATLREVKVNFWRRYKLRYPAEMVPSDTLVSRCYRELDKRLLSVFNVWTVKKPYAPRYNESQEEEDWH